MTLTHTDVVQPIEVGQSLRVVLVFDQLLRASVQQPDVRVGSENLFTVDLEDQTEHSVRCGVLRSKVDCVRWSNGASRELSVSRTYEGGEGDVGDVPVKCRIEASLRDPVSLKISSAESSWSLFE